MNILRRFFNWIFPCRFNEPLCKNSFFGCRCGKVKWWSWPFDTSFITGKKEEARVKPIVDPLKKDVATPLSKYLASDIGKGIPRYTGDLAPTPTDTYQPLQFDQNALNRYNEFLSLDAGSFFDKAVAEPATVRFKSELLPQIREGFAGNLRGSGRFAAEEAGINRFAKDLAVQREKAMVTIPQAQFEMAARKFGLESREQYKAYLSELERFNQQDLKIQREYKDWIKSLPQYNPSLERAVQFLSKGVSSGTDYLAWLDPGREGIAKDLIKIASTAAMAAA